MGRFSLIYGCLVGALLTVMLTTYSAVRQTGAAGTSSVDRCDDENAAVAFICRNTWMANLRTSFR
jgi:hypothetical protein